MLRYRREEWLKSDFISNSHDEFFSDFDNFIPIKNYEYRESIYNRNNKRNNRNSTFRNSDVSKRPYVNTTGERNYNRHDDYYNNHNYTSNKYNKYNNQNNKVNNLSNKEVIYKQTHDYSNNENEFSYNISNNINNNQDSQNLSNQNNNTPRALPRLQNLNNFSPRLSENPGLSSYYGNNAIPKPAYVKVAAPSPILKNILQERYEQPNYSEYKSNVPPAFSSFRNKFPSNNSRFNKESYSFGEFNSRFK